MKKDYPLLVEYTQKVVKIVEGNYSDDELTNEMVLIRKSLSEQLFQLDEIKEITRVGLIKQLIVAIEKFNNSEEK